MRSMRIGIFSDIHSNPRNIDEALAYFAKERVDLVIGAGDISNDIRGLAYVVQNLITTRIPAIIFPGSHIYN